jgi:hypothetical protein
MTEKKRRYSKEAKASAEKRAKALADELVAKHTKKGRKKKTTTMPDEPKGSWRRIRAFASSSFDLARSRRRQVVVHLNDKNKDVMQQRIDRLENDPRMVLIKRTVGPEQTTYIFAPDFNKVLTNVKEVE